MYIYIFIYVYICICFLIYINIYILIPKHLSVLYIAEYKSKWITIRLQNQIRLSFICIYIYSSLSLHTGLSRIHIYIYIWIYINIYIYILHIINSFSLLLRYNIFESYHRSWCKLFKNCAMLFTVYSYCFSIDLHRFSPMSLHSIPSASNQHHVSDRNISRASN